jgi:hypothetical protein
MTRSAPHLLALLLALAAQGACADSFTYVSHQKHLFLSSTPGTNAVSLPGGNKRVDYVIAKDEQSQNATVTWDSASQAIVEVGKVYIVSPRVDTFTTSVIYNSSLAVVSTQTASYQSFEWTNSYNVIPKPIPEAATWGMLLLGLPLVLARRRAGRRQA